VEVLFESNQRGLNAVAVAQSRDLPEYAVELLRGVDQHGEEIGDWLDTYSHGWPRANMPAVDLAVLMLGAYEVVFEESVPDAVALKEAADLAGEYSTDKSAGFVSGLLGRLAAIKDTLR
jgi:N utilization substance protein B